MGNYVINNIIIKMNLVYESHLNVTLMNTFYGEYTYIGIEIFRFMTIKELLINVILVNRSIIVTIHQVPVEYLNSMCITHYTRFANTFPNALSLNIEDPN